MVAKNMTFKFKGNELQYIQALINLDLIESYNLSRISNQEKSNIRKNPTLNNKIIDSGCMFTTRSFGIDRKKRVVFNVSNFADYLNYTQ